MSATATFRHDLAWDSDLRALQTRVPVDVVRIAKEFGLTVWTQDLPDNVSGMIKKDADHGGRAGYSIIVNGKHARVRQRFTVAHEIAHFLLHSDKIGDGLEDDSPLYRSELSTKEEVQANKLAAKILMTFHLLTIEMKSGVRDARELAERFDVSLQAMSIRLGLPE